jgi:hypothetical protein
MCVGSTFFANPIFVYPVPLSITTAGLDVGSMATGRNDYHARSVRLVVVASDLVVDRSMSIECGAHSDAEVAIDRVVAHSVRRATRHVP